MLSDPRYLKKALIKVLLATHNNHISNEELARRRLQPDRGMESNFNHPYILPNYSESINRSQP